jgi:hypothetical protein
MLVLAEYVGDAVTAAVGGQDPHSVLRLYVEIALVLMIASPILRGARRLRGGTTRCLLLEVP